MFVVEHDIWTRGDIAVSNKNHSGVVKNIYIYLDPFMIFKKKGLQDLTCFGALPGVGNPYRLCLGLGAANVT
jgi:hypothetical protein